MHEFTSISVSSYDAASLADRLTEKSAEGWSVVSIVSAGTNVTAYLQRPAAGAAAVAPAEEVEETAPAEDAGTSEDTGDAEMAAAEPVAAEAPVEVAPEPEPVVAEPAGWGTAPETSHPTPEPVVSSGATDAVVTPEPAASEPSIPSFSYGASTTPEPAATPEPQPVVEPTVAFTPVQEQAAQPAQSEPVQQQAAAAVAPAGWYADPSGRYELRYWDGSQWTEHVSRAGQQFTDPPVA
jgi:hypothetical protein